MLHCVLSKVSDPIHTLPLVAIISWKIDDMSENDEGTLSKNYMNKIKHICEHECLFHME